MKFWFKRPSALLLCIFERKKKSAMVRKVQQLLKIGSNARMKNLPVSSCQRYSFVIKNEKHRVHRMNIRKSRKTIFFFQILISKWQKSFERNSVEGEKRDALDSGTPMSIALWSRTTNNRDVHSLVRSFAHTAHSSACNAVLNSLARYTALIRLLARSLIPELVASKNNRKKG